MRVKAHVFRFKRIFVGSSPPQDKFKFLKYAKSIFLTTNISLKKYIIESMNGDIANGSLEYL